MIDFYEYVSDKSDSSQVALTKSTQTNFLVSTNLWQLWMFPLFSSLLSHWVIYFKLWTAQRKYFLFLCNQIYKRYVKVPNMTLIVIWFVSSIKNTWKSVCKSSVMLNISVTVVCWFRLCIKIDLSLSKSSWNYK